jgi:hypothetical protein
MNQRLYTLAWVLIVACFIAAGVLAGQRLSPHRSHDQQILIDKSRH